MLTQKEYIDFKKEFSEAFGRTVHCLIYSNEDPTSGSFQVKICLNREKKNLSYVEVF
jgi:hypothetical protein